MIDQHIKQAYIKTLKDAGVEHPVVKMAEKFINSYDGSNEEHLNVLCLTLTGLLISYKEKSIKADGYDEMVALHKEKRDEMEDIKITFQNLSKGIIPPEPPAGNAE